MQDEFPSPRIHSVLGVSLLAFFGVALGILSQIQIAYYYGASKDLDAFLVAYAVPTIVGAALQMTISSVILPLYLKTIEQDGNEGAVALLNGALLLLLMTVVLILAAGTLFSKSILNGLMLGLPEETLKLAIDLCPILWLACGLQVLFVFFASVLQANLRFSWQAVAPVMGLLLAITSVWLFASRIGIWAYAVGTLLGSILQAGILVPSLVRIWHPRKAAFRKSYLIQVLRISWPMVLSGLIVRATPVMERSAASGFPIGSIANLNYAFRGIGYLFSIVLNGFLVVLFPSLSGVSGDKTKFRSLLIESLHAVFFIFTPVLVLLLLNAEPVVAILLERGSFSSGDAAVVARAILLYSPYAFAAGIGSVIAKGLYALQLTRLAMILDVIGIITYGGLLFLGVHLMGLDGIPLAMSAYYVLFILIAAVFLFRRVACRWTDLKPNLAVKTTLSLAGLVFVSLFLQATLADQDPILLLVVSISLSLLVHVALGCLFGIPVALRLLAILKDGSVSLKK
jgi:putative peptidoglycan lipid II flippase